MTADVSRPWTDSELAEQVLSDPEAFTAVHDRFFRPVYRYVAGRLDAQTAEDIAAETFLVAFDQRKRFDPRRGALRPWLFGIATNLVARHRRAEARRLKALARVGPDVVAGGHEDQVVTSLTAQRMLPRLARGLAALSQGERDAVMLLALGQLGYEEIAQALGVSSGTVGSRLSRARTKLRALIEEENVHG